MRSIIGVDKGSWNLPELSLSGVYGWYTGHPGEALELTWIQCFCCIQPVYGSATGLDQNEPYKGRIQQQCWFQQSSRAYLRRMEIDWSVSCSQPRSLDATVCLFRLHSDRRRVMVFPLALGIPGQTEPIYTYLRHPSAAFFLLFHQEHGSSTQRR